MTTIKVIEDRGASSVVQYKEDGKVKRVIIPTKFINITLNEADQKALKMGIDDGLDLAALDWDYVKVELSNALLTKGLTTIEAIQQNQADFNSAVLAALGKPILRLLKQEKE
jgi:predicted nuclease with TOPRIM domain